MPILSNFGKMSQVLPYVAHYAQEELMSLEMGCNVLTDGQVWQFMSMCAPECQFWQTASISIWLEIVWHTMSKIVRHALICPKYVYYGLLWSAMMKDYQLWSTILRTTNSTTVSPVLKNSVKECEICSRRAYWAKYGGMWTNKASKSPVHLIKA